MQLSSTESGASTMAYMHVAEVVSAAAAQGTLGLLQQSGRLFMVTDYSPEWSYPEVSPGLLLTNLYCLLFRCFVSKGTQGLLRKLLKYFP